MSKPKSVLTVASSLGESVAAVILPAPGPSEAAATSLSDPAPSSRVPETAADASVSPLFSFAVNFLPCNVHSTTLRVAAANSVHVS